MKTTIAATPITGNGAWVTVSDDCTTPENILILLEVGYDCAYLSPAQVDTLITALQPFSTKALK